MQFDDRLATVLRMQAGNERSANTQYRQLLDLAGSAPEGADDALLGQAYARLEELSATIPPHHRAAMVREPGMRLRNLDAVDFLANQETPVAAAAMAAARLSEAQWDVLIPTLPIPARALLRHRGDLPARTAQLLARLGVGDLVLPEPPEARSQEIAGPAAAAALPPMELDPALALDEETSEGIRAIVRRIEAFQRARQHEAPPAIADAPRLPLDEQSEDATGGAASGFDFETDAEGRISWADPAFAPAAVGMMLAGESAEAPVRVEPAALAAIRHRQPLRGARVSISGTPRTAGEWQIDAGPRFSRPGGRFTGYLGRMRRPSPGSATDLPAAGAQANRIRQILHELRTPVNAIQGFAEIIQQQMFGPTPNEYRALAASIAGDAARMLAGFDELDRLVRLEAGALELERGPADLKAIATATTAQLETVLRPRSAGLELAGATDGHEPLAIALARGDAEKLVWRLLATLAGAVAPGEALQIVLDSDEASALLRIELPAALAGHADVFAASAPAQVQAVSAGMFGASFTLRLARAEARAAGGDLSQADDLLALALPLDLGIAENNHGEEMDLDGRIADIG